MMVSPAYLDAAFAAIRKRHGSLAQYAEDVLGLTPAQHDAMRGQLLE
jgi:hypothetical protein